MSKLKDAAVRLYHKRERQHINNLFELYPNNLNQFRKNNYSAIWSWACNRWKDFPYRECELRGDCD